MKMKFCLLLIGSILLVNTSARHRHRKDNGSAGRRYHFTLTEPWDDTLSDKSSSQYQQLASDLIQKIEEYAKQQSKKIEKIEQPDFTRSGTGHVHVTLVVVGEKLVLPSHKRNSIQKRIFGDLEIEGEIETSTPTEKALYEECEDGDCKVTANTECKVVPPATKKTCECVNGFVDVIDTCYPVRSHGGSCEKDEQCPQFQDCNADKQCGCDSISVLISETACGPKGGFGDPCTSPLQCVKDDENMDCISIKCQCKNGFKRDNGLTVCTNPTTVAPTTPKPEGETITVSTEWKYYKDTAPVTPERQEQLKQMNLVLINHHLIFTSYISGEQMILHKVVENRIEERDGKVWAVVQYEATVVQNNKRDLTMERIREAFQKLEEEERSNALRVQLR